ncbi:MAG: SH3 domain-containing protein [Bauldia sp.]|nr:SH3 domain-containing protein [Bauldia sp.]
MTKISPRHAAARRIAEAYPNPLDLQRPEPCSPETAASLRTAYDAAWDAANAAWDELPADETAAADETALLAELETILASEEDEMTVSTAVAVLESAPVDFAATTAGRGLVPVDDPAPPVADEADDAEAFSNLRHIPEVQKTSLAMVLDAAPRRAPRHVHRTPPREAAQKPVVAPALARPARRKRRPVLGTIAVAAVLVGVVGGAVFFLDVSGTPASEQTAGTDIPWIRAQTGVANTLLARPTAPAATAAEATLDTPATVLGAAPLAEKADERVPQTEAVPPLTTAPGDVRIVTTEAVTAAPATAAAAPPPAPAAEPAAATGVTAATWVNMRAGAGADEAVVAVIEPGAAVEVIACANWCEVVVNGQRGFIYNDYLTGLR